MQSPNLSSTLSKLSCLCHLWLCLGLWLTACKGPPILTPTPTPPATLNASLWVDYPVVSNGYKQAANVVVNDTRGKPVSGANIIGEYVTPTGKQVIYFPSTDGEGRSRVPLPLPSTIKATQVLTLTVRIVQNSQWGEGSTTFQIVP